MSIPPITSVQLPSHILIDGKAPKESRADSSFSGQEYDYQGVVDFDRVHDLETLQEFQKEHPNLNIYGRCGITPLGIAIGDRCIPVIEAILDKTPSLVNKSWHDSDVTYMISASGSLDAVKALVKHGANINITTRIGETPLDAASRRGRLNVTKYLLLHGGVLYLRSGPRISPEKLAEQHKFINKVIKHIKAEYESAHKGFERIVFPRTITKTSDGKKVESEPQKTIFSKLPSHLIRHVMSFSSEPFHLHKQFVEKINTSSPTEEEVKQAASSPDKPA